MAKIKKHELSFGGKMELVEIEVDDFPKEILKADDWFGPQVGELCFINGKIDVVKTLAYARHVKSATHNMVNIVKP